LSSLIVLDASPLSLLCHPDTRIPVVAEINLWLEARLLAGATVYVSEIADYEVRRELIRAGKRRSLRKLDSPDRTGRLPATRHGDDAAGRRVLGTGSKPGYTDSTSRGVGR
jgi:hypothetical protein